MADWEHLEELFFDCLGEWIKPSHSDIEYLKNAFIEIEEFWLSSVKEIGQPRFIILGEAPLYGASKSYVYNPNSKVTSFLRPTDFPGVETNSDGKNSLLNLLQTYGIVVVDLLPFALPCPGQPNLTYRSMPHVLYKRLIHLCFLNYSFHKITYLTSKNANAKFLIRYKSFEKNGLRDVVQARCLENNKITPAFYDIYSHNHPVDRSKFHSVLHGT